jgi:hypothetical protein
MNAITRVIAAQLPATCPRNCVAFCRTPNHGEGDSGQVERAVWKTIKPNNELYLTSNGETGHSPIFRSLIAHARNRHAFVSALGATVDSVHEDLCRVEISWNRYTHKDAKKAIEKAHDLRVPVVLSFVDDGAENNDTEALAKEHRAQGTIVRALQAEGLSRTTYGVTRWWVRQGVFLGACPVFAYGEFRQYKPSYELINIDHFGREVPLLGSPVQLAA